MEEGRAGGRVHRVSSVPHERIGTEIGIPPRHGGSLADQRATSVDSSVTEP